MAEHVPYRKGTGGELGRPSTGPTTDNPMSALDFGSLLGAPVAVLPGDSDFSEEAERKEKPLTGKEVHSG